MPLIIKETSPGDITTLIWHRTEPDSFFLQQVDIREGKWEEVLKWTTKRREEWLAGRFLIEHYLGCSSRNLIIDTNGKPHLNHSTRQLSLSHSGHLIGVSYAAQPIGLDIQWRHDSIDKISHKFCNPQELDLFGLHNDAIDKTHFIWTCKEAIYKAYGRRLLDFKEHIHLMESEWKMGFYEVFGRIKKEDIEISYHLRVRKIDNLYITIASEQ
jgi:4'-phosphopantetheinyl transferase